jgi:putative acetyltransferase
LAELPGSDIIFDFVGKRQRLRTGQRGGARGPDEGLAGMKRIRPTRPTDLAAMLGIWRRAIDATHDFLSSSDRAAIDLDVQALLPDINAWVAVDQDNEPIGFISAEEAEIAALFVDPDHHRSGHGRALINHVVGDRDVVTVSVNEQNHAAVGFYQSMGFVALRRTELDGQGRAYPLLHMMCVRKCRAWRGIESSKC